MKNTDVRSQLSAELRKQAEEVSRDEAVQPTENLETLSPEEFRRTLHELRVHQIELEMQNEELRRRQVELETARERYFNFYDLSPVGYCTLSDKGIVLEANVTATTLFGITRSELISQPITQFIIKEDQDKYYLHRKKLFEIDESQSIELRMVKKDGTQFWAHLEVTHVQTPDGTPVSRIVMSDITERKHSEDALRSLLVEKDILLREVHHRVKNNLASIIALLDLQRKALGDSSMTNTLSELGMRIKSMALIHEQLYRSENLSHIDAQEYLRALISLLCTSLNTPKSLHCTVNAAGVTMGLDTAIPIGMMVNELAMNSMKYAFPKGKPSYGQKECELNVSLEQVGETCTLIVADNGVGMREDNAWETTTTLGLRLVRALGEHQLGGTIAYDGSLGTRFILRFQPKEDRTRL